MAWHGMRGQCIASDFFVLAHISTHGVEKRTYKIPFCVQRIVWIQLGDDKQAATLALLVPENQCRIGLVWRIRCVKGRRYYRE